MGKKWLLLSMSFLLFCLIVSSLSSQSFVAVPLNDKIIETSKEIEDNNPQLSNQNTEATSWWNKSFEYRVKISITERANLSITLFPINVYLEFEENHAHKDSIRVLFWDGNNWIGPLISQVWNKTFYDDGIHLKSATVTFLVNLTEYETVNYYIYYSKYDRGTISFTPMVQGYEDESIDNDYWFQGKYYKVYTNHLRNGKIEKLWHLITNNEIGNPGSPGNTYFPTHYDPYSTALGNTYGAAINVEGITESGPIFIKYHTTAQFSGSYDDKAEITYTFYWFGWVVEVNSSCNDDVDWSYFYSIWWMFDPGVMPSLYIFREPNDEEIYENFATGTWNRVYKYGNVTRVAFYDTNDGEGVGYGEIDVQAHKFTSYARFHYIYYYYYTYQYWYKRYNEVVNDAGSWEYEKYVIVVWNATEGLDPFKKITIEFQNSPEIEIGEERIIFQLKVNVFDGNNNPVPGANVYVFSGDQLIQSGITQSNGYIILPIDQEGTYDILVNYTTSYQQNDEYMTVSAESQAVVEYPDDVFQTVSKDIFLPMGTLNITVIDLLGRDLASDAIIEIYNGGYEITGGPRTTTNGQIILPFFPHGEYTIYTSYQPLERSVEFWIFRITETQIDFSFTQSEFIITQPIGDLLIKVNAYDGHGIHDISLLLSNASNVKGVKYHSISTNATGYAYLYRIENATWNLHISATDSYNQPLDKDITIFRLNNTLSESTLSVVLPLTRLNILVTVGGENYEGATIEVRKEGSSNILTSGTTNASGQITFSLILEGKYNVTAIVYISKNSSIIYASNNYSAVFEFKFPGFTYSEKDSVMVNGNSTNVFFYYYNDNITIKVNYYNRTGLSTNPIDIPISGSENITIWIYLGNNLVHHITKGSSLGNIIIEELNNGTYYLHISTSLLKLNVSALYYTIKVIIYNKTYNSPTPISYLLKVVSVDADAYVSKDSITVEWSKKISFTLYYNDTIHNLPIPDANITYVITNIEQTYYYKSTFDYNPNNKSYVLNVDTDVINAIPDTYTITIYVNKINYQSHVFYVSLKVDEIQTKLKVIAFPSNSVSWMQEYRIIAMYTYSNGTAITNAEVSMKMDDSVYELNWNGTHYVSSTFNSSVLIPGEYAYLINATKMYHEQKLLFANITILKAPANLLLTINGTSISANGMFNVTYEKGGILELSAFYSQSECSYGIENGYLYLSIRETGYLTAFNEKGDGIYNAIINFSELYVTRFSVTIYASHQNFSDISFQFTLNVTPQQSFLTVNKLEFSVIWGEKPTLIVEFTDNYGDPITDAIITVNWTEAGLVFSRQENIYVATIDTSFEEPGNYTLVVSASALNYRYQQVIVKLQVLIPLEIDIPKIVEKYWLETINITMYIHDLYNNRSLDNADVKYSWAFGSGGFTFVGRGLYILTLNLTQYPTGDYNVNVTVMKEGYPTIHDNFTLRILPAPMKFIYVDIQSGNELEIGQNLTVKILLEETVFNNPLDDANVTMIIYSEEEVVAAAQFDNTGNGTYFLSFNTENLSLGSYLVEIYASKENYASPKAYVFTLLIKEQTVNLVVARIPVSTLYFSSSVAISAIGIFGGALYGYRLYKIPWIIRALDKVIRSIAKGKKTIDFSKFPQIEDVLRDILGSEFSKVRREPPRKITE